ncbi:MAG: hypothetical protein GY788_01335 [bacterium]|nr:hypothetical protein [bacterium]
MSPSLDPVLSERLPYWGSGPVPESVFTHSINVPTPDVSKLIGNLELPDSQSHALDAAFERLPSTTWGTSIGPPSDSLDLLKSAAVDLNSPNDLTLSNDTPTTITPTWSTSAVLPAAPAQWTGAPLVTGGGGDGRDAPPPRPINTKGNKLPVGVPDPVHIVKTSAWPSAVANWTFEKKVGWLEAVTDYYRPLWWVKNRLSQAIGILYQQEAEANPNSAF